MTGDRCLIRAIDAESLPLSSDDCMSHHSESGADVLVRKDHLLLTSDVSFTTRERVFHPDLHMSLANDDPVIYASVLACDLQSVSSPLHDSLSSGKVVVYFMISGFQDQSSDDAGTRMSTCFAYVTDWMRAEVLIS